MPYAIQTASFFEALRKRLRIQGYVAGQLIDDLIPTVDLLNPTPDLQVLTGLAPWAAFEPQLAVAAQSSYMTLGSATKLVQVQGAITDTAGVYGFLLRTGALFEAGNTMEGLGARDSRNDANTDVGCSSSSAAAPGANWAAFLPQGLTKLDITLPPGTSLRWALQTVNTAWKGTLLFYVRDFDQGESLRT